MSKQPEAFTTKLGSSKTQEKSRIWIEGERLKNAGFEIGSYYVKQWQDDLTLYLLSEDDVIEPGTAPAVVSGSESRPIVDIACNQVNEVFGKKFSKVSVEFRPGVIVIKGAE